MSFWQKAKDVSVAARLKDEEYHARAMYEIQQGRRRDGLWAKALSTSNGNEPAGKILYFKLLVQAIKDDDHIANRVSQARVAAPRGSLESKQPSLPAALGKPGLLKSLWFWFLVILAMGLFVVALPYLFDGKASVWHYLIAGFWLLVANYALKKLFPKAKS